MTSAAATPVVLDASAMVELVLRTLQGRWLRSPLAGPLGASVALVAAGCHCNRDIAGAIAAGGFSLEWSLAGAMPKAPPIVRPLLSAVARPVLEPAGGRGLVDAGARSGPR